MHHVQENVVNLTIHETIHGEKLGNHVTLQLSVHNIRGVFFYKVTLGPFKVLLIVGSCCVMLRNAGTVLLVVSPFLGS